MMDTADTLDSDEHYFPEEMILDFTSSRHANSSRGCAASNVPDRPAEQTEQLKGETAAREAKEAELPTEISLLHQQAELPTEISLLHHQEELSTEMTLPHQQLAEQTEQLPKRAARTARTPTPTKTARTPTPTKTPILIRCDLCETKFLFDDFVNHRGSCGAAREAAERATHTRNVEPEATREPTKNELTPTQQQQVAERTKQPDFAPSVTPSSSQQLSECIRQPDYEAAAREVEEKELTSIQQEVAERTNVTCNEYNLTLTQQQQPDAEHAEQLQGGAASARVTRPLPAFARALTGPRDTLHTRLNSADGRSPISSRRPLSLPHHRRSEAAKPITLSLELQLGALQSQVGELSARHRQQLDALRAEHAASLAEQEARIRGLEAQLTLHTRLYNDHLTLHETQIGS
jgi:hypothetical protein